ncbi:hypothetical protein ACWEWX_45930, partial [Streptomyces asiaticus]
MRRQHMPARGGEHHVQARRGAEDGQLTGGGDVAALVSEAASMLLLASADGAVRAYLNEYLEYTSLSWDRRWIRTLAEAGRDSG